MAISFKELQSKVHSGKSCIGFDYVLEYGEQKEEMEFHFRRNMHEPLEWHLQTIIPRVAPHCNDEPYHVAYVLPKENINLEMVAAIGLRYFQLAMKEQVQKKSLIDFEIGDRLAGMLGDGSE